MEEDHLQCQEGYTPFFRALSILFAPNIKKIRRSQGFMVIMYHHGLPAGDDESHLPA